MTTKSITLILCIIFPAISWAELKDENLLMELPPGYKIEKQHKKGNTITTQMVPNSQSLKNWKETLAVNTFLGDKKATVEAFQKFSLINWMNACPATAIKKDVKLIKKGKKSGYPFAIWMFSCVGKPESGFTEYAWFKAIKGNDSFYVIQKSFKFEPSVKQTTHWIKYIENISVCDTRLPDNACPSLLKSITK